MNQQVNMFPGRKRRKPIQKGVKPTPAEGAKSNPSKRHRDRLNSELDRLANMLPFPEDVISSLDKLSILRLSVSFLRTKSFFSEVLTKPLCNGKAKSNDGNDRMAASADRCIPEGELLMQALNGFVLVVTAGGIVFFCSHTIQDYLGFQQTDVMHQSVFELIHAEDQQEFRRNLHWALNPPDGSASTPDPSTDGESVSNTSCLVSYNPDQLPPENSSFLERGFICRFRCLLDNSSGFLALNIQGRLKFLHGQSRPHKDSVPSQLALFAIATPIQPPAILEIRTKNTIFRTKHKLDFTPMACDAKGKIVLGYTEAELRVRGSGYQFIHAADMLYCAENHIRMIKTGESGLTVFRLLTKDNRWKWVQANARLVYKNNKPDYIIATQRPLAEEEGGEHLRKRSMHLPFTFATGEATLYQTGFPLHGFPDSFQGKPKGGKSKNGKRDQSSADDLDPKSLLGALMSQDKSVYICQASTDSEMSYQSGLIGQQQTETGTFSSLLGGDGWNIGRCKDKMSSYDPLLATLDSLSLDGDDTCSNIELFNALENLGLDAEDLELLLLDERMVHLELDPNNHIPTLSDHLTSNDIHSLEGGVEEEEQEATGEFGLADLLQNTDLAPSVSQLTLDVPIGMKPVVQPSQINSVSEHGVHDCNNLFLIPNDQCLTATSSHTHHHHHPVFKASQLNIEQKYLHIEQWQSVEMPSHHQESSHTAFLPEFRNHLGQTTTRSCTTNGYTAPALNMEISSMGYTPYTNGVATPDACHYQPQGHQKHQQTFQHTHVASSCLPQSSALNLEQFLQHSLPSLQPYSMFSSSAEDATQSKLENNCLLSATNSAHIKTCLIPNRNSLVTDDVPVSCPEGLAAPQEPHTSGFYL